MWKSKVYGAFVLNRRVVLHAIDATPAQCLICAQVVEPVFFGHSMRLHPVVVLLSLMIWGFIWGVPGCVLAVPITAVLRIYLQSIDHPLALALANVLDGFARPVSAFLPPPSERPSTAYAAV